MKITKLHKGKKADCPSCRPEVRGIEECFRQLRKDRPKRNYNEPQRESSR